MLVIGHRGYRGLLPENTIDACIEAIQLGVQAIEIDAVISADKEVVVSHEPFISRVTCTQPNGKEIPQDLDQKINLYELPYATIRQYDCGLKPHNKFPEQRNIPCFKPLLTELIIACESFIEKNNLPSITYIIEIKSKPEWYTIYHPEPIEYVQLVLNEISSFSFKHRIVLKSFDVNILNEIYRQDTLIEMSLLIYEEECIEDKLALLNFTPTIIGPQYQLLTRSIVEEYQNKGFKVFPWTINELEDIKIIQSYGVDGIITDYPNRIINE